MTSRYPHRLIFLGSSVSIPTRAASISLGWLGILLQLADELRCHCIIEAWRRFWLLPNNPGNENLWPRGLELTYLQGLQAPCMRHVEDNPIIYANLGEKPDVRA
jgi:hypothetical protein